MKISACLITKNEENNIEQCINSYRDFVNEVIVVDTGSIDDTIAIARRLGAKVFHYAWNDDFAAAKNFALAKAKGDWVIFLDADEYFGKSNVKKVIERAHSEGSEVIVARLKNIDVDDDNKIIDIIQQIRIIKNSRLLRYKGAIHESITKRNGQKLLAYYASEQDLVIFHTGYSSSIRSAKAKRNLAFLLKELEEGNLGVYGYISDCYYEMGEYERTIEFARKQINSGIIIYGLQAKPYQNVVESMLALKYRTNRIQDFLTEAIAKFPGHPAFVYYLALNLFREKRYRQAYDYFQQTLELQKVYSGAEINNVQALIPRILCYLGLISVYQNNSNNAFDYYVNSLREYPRDDETFINIMRLITNQKAEDQILFIKSIYDTRSKEILNFLISMLRRIKLGKILLYFVNEYEKQFGRHPDADINMAFILLTHGKYENAYTSFYGLSQIGQNWADLYATVSLLLNGDGEVACRFASELPLQYQKIVRAFYGLEDTEGLTFNMHMSPVYIDILQELILLDEIEVLTRYLKLKTLLQAEIAGLIGDKLQENGKFDLAVEQYNEIDPSNISEQNEAKKYYFYTGYCYYRMHDFANAVKYFEFAVEAGYRNYDIIEFLCWTYDQCNNDYIREKSVTLLKVINEVNLA